MARKPTGKPPGRPRKEKPVVKDDKPAGVISEKVLVNDLTMDKDVQIRRLKEENKSLSGLVNFWKGKVSNGKTEEKSDTQKSSGSTGNGNTTTDDGGNTKTTHRGGIFGDIF